MRLTRREAALAAVVYAVLIVVCATPLILSIETLRWLLGRR